VVGSLSAPLSVIVHLYFVLVARACTLCRGRATIGAGRRGPLVGPTRLDCASSRRRWTSRGQGRDLCRHCGRVLLRGGARSI
jgi:hypothetical protein